jgi:hypothetical protein
VYCACGRRIEDELEMISGDIQPSDRCTHQGELYGKIDCGCQGDVSVFKCAKHGLAAKQKRKPGTHQIITLDGSREPWIPVYCVGCDDFELKGKSGETMILSTGDPTRYWTMEDLLGLAKGLASEIAKEHEISAVAGVPRSGMLAASAMAIHLSVPLLEASTQGLRSLTHGRRIENVPQKGRTIVVEDSLNTGRRFSELKRSLGEEHIYASIFSTPRSKHLADYVGCELPLPHWFDWWLYGSRAMQQMRIGIDFDGILCGDCPRDTDDDGERYSAWMQNVPAIRHVFPHGVPLIITGRLEKYRSLTESWLARNRQVASKIIFGHWPDIAARRGQSIAAFKAQQIVNEQCSHFIESDPRQAREIVERTGIPVICPELRACLMPKALRKG